jgi:hypothetical protein
MYPTHTAYATQGTHALVHLSHYFADELQSRTYRREAAIDDHKLQHSIRTDRSPKKHFPDTWESALFPLIFRR